MIHKTIKAELDELKEVVRIHTRANYRISYADVIVFLIKHYKDTLKSEYALNQKLLVAKNIEKNNLSVSRPLTPKPYSAITKLDQKTRVSFLLES